MTPQNAGASERVSSTSEELATEAGQLQSTIACFRIGADMPAPLQAADPARASQDRNPVARLNQQVVAGIKPVHPPAVSQPRRASKVMNGGLALDMDDGADQHDAEF